MSRYEWTGCQKKVDMPEKLYETTLQHCLDHYRYGWRYYIADDRIVGTRKEKAALNPQSHSATRYTRLYYKGETERCKWK